MCRSLFNGDFTNRPWVHSAARWNQIPVFPSLSERFLFLVKNFGPTIFRPQISFSRLPKLEIRAKAPTRPRYAQLPSPENNVQFCQKCMGPHTSGYHFLGDVLFREIYPNSWGSPPLSNFFIQYNFQNGDSEICMITPQTLTVDLERY